MATKGQGRGQGNGARGALRHGSIWWANLPAPAGRRPVLVLTRDAVLGRMANVTIAPLTRTDRALPTEVRLTTSDGVPTACVVSLDNLLTIPVPLLDQPVVQLGPDRMQQVYAAIRTALQMP